MNAREITVMSTVSQDRRVIMSGAETLGQLKSDLERNGINYEGMRFLEGLTKTELLNNDSVLPKDVNYRGEVTNNLVIFLSTENKKIKSGIDRIAVYAEIKSNGLQDEVQRVFGRNFTQVSTAELLHFLATKTQESEKCKSEKSLEERFDTLLDILYDMDYLDGQDIEEINEGSCCGGIQEVGPYSKNEIYDMLANLD